jgi:hypothetical protein
MVWNLGVQTNLRSDRRNFFYDGKQRNVFEAGKSGLSRFRIALLGLVKNKSGSE